MTDIKSIDNIFNILNCTETKITKKCTHYNNNLQVYANCCKKYYDCHLCHNEEEGHNMNRLNISKIKCITCSTVNSPSHECKSCNTSYSDYHCNICNLWTTNKEGAFHCNKCGGCKIGKAEDYYHCDTCNICFLKSKTSRHVCTTIDKNAECTICLNKIFNIKYGIVLLTCKHLIHKECLDELIKSTNGKIPGCTLCKKSVVDHTKYEHIFDNFIRENQLPEYYSKWSTDILCNDCTQKSNVKYHNTYHKCTSCKSYNTSIMNVNKIK